MRDALNAALEWAASLGPAGQLLFILLYVAACVFGLPGSVLTLGAGAVWGLWRGFALVWIGACLGLCAAFLVSRFLLHDWVERRVERYPLFSAVRRAVAHEGWKVVLLTRLSPVLPFFLLNYAYGLTRVSLREYALASWVGIVPGTFLFVYLGSAAGEAVRSGARERSSAEWAFLVVGLCATALALALIGRAAKKALKQQLG